MQQVKGGIFSRIEIWVTSGFETYVVPGFDYGENTPFVLRFC